MRLAYFDCFSGASGDMILGACLHAGLELEVLRADLAGLDLKGYELAAQRIGKQGFAATQFQVHVDSATQQPHRHLHHVREIIDKSPLAPRVREQALAIFTRLAEVEAAVHGTTTEKVHFHEVGAVDAIVDIVGVCVALDRLGVDRVCCSPIPAGSGTVRCEHGIMPVPAPATAELLKGVPLADCDEPGELTTPTGAAILTTLAQGFGPMSAMVIERVGVGAGQREGVNRANILRLFVGQSVDVSADGRPGTAGEESDEIDVLETNLDDVSGEVIGHVYDRLFAAGALDVFATPIYMKKNRPATQITVLIPPHLREAAEAVLFAETTTFGVRCHRAQRQKLTRTIETVETQVGPIRVKVGRRGGRVMAVAPEFEDCRAAADRSDRPVIELMNLATRTWWSSAGAAESRTGI